MTPVVAGSATGTTFGKDKRLLCAEDYTRVFKHAEFKASHNHFLLLAARNNKPGHRLGLVVAKKNVRLAVQRNRMKRMAREFFRQLSPTNYSLDVILLARKDMDKLDNAELYTILRQQWAKIDHRAAKQLTPATRDC